jgi:hypothetical protein
VLAGVAALLNKPVPAAGFPKRLEVKGLPVPAGLAPNNPPGSGDELFVSDKPNGFLGGVDLVSSDDIFNPNKPPSLSPAKQDDGLARCLFIRL